MKGLFRILTCGTGPVGSWTLPWFAHTFPPQWIWAVRVAAAAPVKENTSHISNKNIGNDVILLLLLRCRDYVQTSYDIITIQSMWHDRDQNDFHSANLVQTSLISNYIRIIVSEIKKHDAWTQKTQDLHCEFSLLTSYKKHQKKRHFLFTLLQRVALVTNSTNTTHPASRTCLGTVR
jgi:hypothetical protein